MLCHVVLHHAALCCVHQVMSASFSPDGSRAVTASKDGTLRIWKTDVRYQLQVSLFIYLLVTTFTL
jgi:WD40 repeat protein